MPLCLGTFGSVRASSIMYSETWANEVHTFWPLITQYSPSLTARVCRDARSEPAFGSEYPWHQISSHERIFAG